MIWEGGRLLWRVFRFGLAGMHYTGSWRPHVQRGCFSFARLSLLLLSSSKELPPVLATSRQRCGQVPSLPPLGVLSLSPPAMPWHGGRYVSRRDYCAGMRLPRAIGGASQLVSFIRRFTRPGGRDPCRGRGGGLRCKRACQGLPGLSGDSVRGIAHTVPTLLNAVRLCICRYWPISQVRKVLRTFFALFSSLNAVRLCIC